MIAFFRRRPAPAPAPLITDHDIAVKTAWGLSLGEWLRLTDHERADLRNNLAHALRKAS